MTDIPDEFDDTYDAFEFAGLRLTVDLRALAENWRDMSRRSGSARTAAVVKADAYGIGIEAAALGKPVVVGGAVYYADLGFVWSASTRVKRSIT